ncbi:hypothetical protein [Nonomuraea gerenzanensis]|uniref:Lipoprotein n=1 Tax=Nonomuraea gerenzanensis TaxID=93944 RepID=A0A1M4E4E9_9ACTN|nr:hypothetical protein [Nonomuraea gerenzanensis]UBU15860.1 hypothetical protein LCN96_12865 [Nonomuraea gerenzanensis]SBO93650.1 hypothetical protein BN4615_P3164 [Nonomuraea gerenzanensis]
MRMALVVLMMSLVTVGCAPDTTAPARAAERFHAALSAHQEEAACAMLARKTADKLPDSGQSCAEALRELGLGAGGQVTQVAVWGDDAQVRLAGDTLFLHRFSDGWRIRAAGCEPMGDLPYDCEVDD